MKQYVGTRMIHADPMTRDEYNQYRGWKIPENENPEDEGYHIVYSDGYDTWIPQKQFDEVYRGVRHLTFGIAVELLKKGKKVARQIGRAHV